MTWILISGAVICGWAMLRTMGAERERRVIEQRPAPPAPPRAAPPPSPPPTWAPTKKTQKPARRQAA